MKNLKVLVILSLFLLLSGCSKNENKEVTQNKVDNATGNQVDKTTNGNETSGLKLFKIKSVSDSKKENETPNFSWDENGKTVSLEDFRGNVIFINFWATWCVPCKKEMPDLSAIASELNEKEFKMFGLNVFHQPGTQDVAAFLKANPVSYTIIDGNEQIVEAFKKASGNDLNAVPTTFIIDKEGKIVETIVGARNKETFMKSINKYL